MTTVNQRWRHGTSKKKDNSTTPALLNCPQRKGTVLQLRIITPKKPNSARRSNLKVKLTNRKCILSRLTGNKHSTKKFSKILARGGGAPDLPQVSYTTIRGALDYLGMTSKTKRRSVYGVEQPISKKRLRRKERRRRLLDK